MTAARLRIAFVVASVGWTLMLALAPLLASRPHASVVGTAAVVAAYTVGSIVCHQLPERSFHAWTAQMPVCARCTGIYLGAALVACVGALRPGSAPLRTRDPRRPAWAPTRDARRWLALAAAPTLVTLLYEWTTGVTPANWIRCAAGIPLGAAVAWLLVAASRDQVN